MKKVSETAGTSASKALKVEFYSNFRILSRGPATSLHFEKILVALLGKCAVRCMSESKEAT